MTVQNSTAVYSALIESELKETRNFMTQQLQCSDERLAEFTDYIKKRQGKMLRASVLLLCGKLTGRITKLHISIAGTVEMIHSATLLHDDVIDNSTIRRFQPTANRLWGANQAVLLGDFILSRAFAALLLFGRNDVNKIIGDTAGIICQGEMLQNKYRGNFNISVEDYLDIIAKKTAVFFAASAQLGAVISGADQQTSKNLYDFGLNLGIAFQIADDLADVAANENQTGKTTGRDLENKIPTLPTIKNTDFTKEQIVRYQQKALNIIACFNESPAAKALKELTMQTA